MNDKGGGCERSNYKHIFLLKLQRPEIVLIQRMVKKQLVLFVKRIAPVIPSLYVVDADIPVSELSKDEEKLEKDNEVYSAIKESPDEAPEKWSHAQAKEGHL
ncbi:hypothetical protein J5N97_018610 [Dioscorea zingiberensis]|uniref:Uncharacterized protein n=1 Tax=Dioscorea zingiberensis TaxID=325984 RepID=A0A9D5HBL9_9LILI|nr:hypothetical protein J5N97_018610 [Dioscorea zingiberensis]